MKRRSAYDDLARTLMCAVEGAIYDNSARPVDVLTALCAAMSFAVALMESEDHCWAVGHLEKVFPKILTVAARSRDDYDAETPTVQ